MSSVTQTVYMTKMIREGFEAADVQLWQSLLQQAKTDIGDSHTYLFLLLDMARHNKCHVMEIVKTGRVCSEQKNINEKFMQALHECLTEDVETVKVGESSTKVLDLTCDEEPSESGSYEETSREYNDNPTSAEAYEIDGFVVEDHDSESRSVTPPAKLRQSSAATPAPKRLLKRRLVLEEE